MRMAGPADFTERYPGFGPTKEMGGRTLVSCETGGVRNPLATGKRVGGARGATPASRTGLHVAAGGAIESQHACGAIRA